MPDPFEIGRAVGTNLGSSFENLQDSNAIDRILKQKYNTQDPNAINAILGQLATQVSPTNRQQGMDMFGHRQKAEQQKIQSANQRKAYQSAGLDESLADLDPAIAKELIKNQQEKNSKKQESGDLLRGAFERADEILKGGNTGIFTGGKITPSGRRERAEFDNLGEIFISQLIPLLNPRGTISQPRFEYIKSLVPSSKYTDATNRGKIDGLMRIFAGDLSGIEGSSQGSSNTIEMKDSQGNVYDIPKEYESQARQQGYS